MLPYIYSAENHPGGSGSDGYCSFAYSALACYSKDGQEQNNNCISRFVGRVVQVKYQIRAVPEGRPADVMLRERVEILDQDPRLERRPVFERVQSTVNGEATDIQAFGYDETPLTAKERPIERASFEKAWRIYEQQLFLGKDQKPFAIIKWKHTIPEIRIIDAYAPPPSD